MQVVGSVMPAVQSFTIPVSIYTLDGGTPVSFDESSLANPGSSEQQDDITFYLSDVLDYKFHTLIINVTVASPQSPYALDYIIFSEGSTGVIANSSSSIPQSPQPTSSNSSQHTTASDQSTTTPPPPSSSSSATSNTTSAWWPPYTAPATHSGSSKPVGAIVGGVVGGLAVVAIALVTGLYVLRKRNQVHGSTLDGGQAEDRRPPPRMSLLLIDSYNTDFWCYQV